MVFYYKFLKKNRCNINKYSKNSELIKSFVSRIKKINNTAYENFIDYFSDPDELIDYTLYLRFCKWTKQRRYYYLKMV